MTHYGICHLSAVALRAEPTSKSEMVSMLLLGETFEILDARNGWLRIRCTYDGYEAWIEGKQFDSVSAEQVGQMAKTPLYCLDTLCETLGQGKEQITALLGSSLPLLDGNTFHIAHRDYQTTHARKAEFTNVASLLNTAQLYLNAPYFWGGRSPFGIDCSGFTQVVYKMHGIALKRDAWQQASQGNTVDFVESARAGDLAFFDNAEGKITHVGILLNETNIIHASGKVRIDRFDRSGIIHEESGKCTHKLRIIRRVLPD